MNISKVPNCTGCMACLDKCPKQCISVSKDKLGHLYPNVNLDLCIDCSLCSQICPALNLVSLSSPIKVIASWRKNEAERQLSSSGGIATAISEFFIKKGGIVYGCAFESVDFTFKHIRCETLEQLSKLKGSKYVFSCTKGIYKLVASDLKNGKKVLFIGTPCQVAGVKSYIAKSFQNLYTIDLVCHGAPSSILFKESLPRTLFSHKVDTISFRNSTSYQIRVFEKGNLIYDSPIHRNLYLKGFFTALYNRKSCYACFYAQGKRIGDISLGDFWGLKMENINVDNVKGISLCLVNTEKGLTMMQDIKEITIQYERTFAEASNNNAPLKTSVKRSFRSKVFSLIYPYLGIRISTFVSIPEIIIKNFFFRK